MLRVLQARLYLQANQTALEQYCALCRSIDCDFETQDAFVYSLNVRERIEREGTALRELGVDANIRSELPLPLPVVSAVQIKNQAQFHPLKFAAAVAEGLPIFEHTKVRELMPGRAVTSGGTIRAKKMIIFTHFPMLNKHGGFFLKARLLSGEIDDLYLEVQKLCGYLRRTISDVRNA